MHSRMSVDSKQARMIVQALINMGIPPHIIIELPRTGKCNPKTVWECTITFEADFSIVQKHEPTVDEIVSALYSIVVPKQKTETIDYVKAMKHYQQRKKIGKPVKVRMDPETGQWYPIKEGDNHA